MRKIKFLIASMVGAIALVFACVLGTRVDAATTMLYDATSDTAGNTYSKNTTINTVATNTFDLRSIGADVEVTTVSSTNYLFFGTGSSSSKGFQIQNKSTTTNYTITFSVLATDSGKGIKTGATFTFNGTEVTSASTAVEVSAVLSASSTAMLYVNSSRRILLKSVTSEEALVDTYSVTYMDGSLKLKDETVVSGSSISYTPVKYGYDLEGWYTDPSLDSQYKVNTSTYTVTGDVTLYANWTEWTNTGITEYTLTNSAITKIATGLGDSSLSADLALTPSIYTAMSGVAMTTTNVTLPDETSGQLTCFNTNGAVKTNGNGLKFTAPANGTLTAYIGSGGGSSRNIKFTDGTDVLEPTSGSVAVGTIEGARYTPVEIVYAVEEGTTYYLGGDNGVRIYYISFEAAPAKVADSVTATLYKQFDNDTNPTKVRLIGKIEGIAPADYANIENVLMEFDFNGTHKSAYCHKLYRSVATLDNSLVAGDNTMYVVLTIGGLDKYDTRSFTTVKMTITFSDDSTKVATHDNF